MATVSTRKPATCKPLIVSTEPFSEGSRCLGSFTFDDGATVRSNGGLICSEHGRRHCAHHKAAHDAIVAKAASSEAATWAAMEAAEVYDADYDAWLDVVDAASPQPSPDDDDPEPEPPAPSPVAAHRESIIASVLETMPYKQRCTRCGQYWHVKAPAKHYVCPTCEQNDREQVEDYWRDFPLLMDVEAEVARVTAEMEAEGFCWSGEARTWVRKPTIAQRAVVALPADPTPETFSIFKGATR